MKTELLVALIAGGVSLAAGALAVWGQVKSARLSAELQAQHERVETEKSLTRYREPLARAAYDLQSRFYNILNQGLISVYYDRGDEREKHYVVDNTVFLIAQYFAWTEIIRRDIQYIDLGQDTRTRQLARLQDEIYTLFQTDRFDPILRVFAGEQRAIGELMILDAARGPECMGYAAFLGRLAVDHDPMTEFLRQDVPKLSTHLDAARPRLVAIQHAMVDLLAFLDPDFVRFPKERRTKALNY